MKLELECIKVQNFLSYGKGQNVFIFKQGLDLVTAVNGSGKSAIFLDALNYGLFGKPFRKIKLKSLQNHINTKELYVELDFKANSTRYKIKRQMNPSLFEIYKEDELIPEESNIKTYQNYLEENILGFSEDIFKSLIAIHSGNSKNYLELSKSEKEQIFNYLIDTEIFFCLSDICKKHINFYKTQKTENEYKTKILIDLLKTEKERLEQIIRYNKQLEQNRENDIKELEQKNLTLIENKDNIIAKLNKKEKINKALMLLETQILKLKENQKENKQIINDLEQKILLIKSAEKGSIECKKCKEINYSIDIDKSLIENKHIIEQELEQRKSENKTLEQEIENKNTKLYEVKNSLNKLALLEKELEKNSQEVKQIKEQIEKLKNSNSLELNADLYKQKNKELEQAKESLLSNKANLEKYQWIYDLVSKNTLKGDIISSQIPLLNKYINQFLEKFDLNTYNIIIQKDFTEKIVSRNQEIEYSQLSSGQKARLNFSISFGFLKLMEQRNSVNTNVLILDEALDSSLDSEGRADLLDILKEEFNKKNIIVVSHNQEIKEKEEIFNRQITITKDKFSKINIS